MPQNNTAKHTSAHTVLLTRFSALGDVAMTIPVVYSACRANPDVQFVMVTRPSMCSMFVNAPANLIVEGADVKGEYDGVRGLSHLASGLVEKYSPDLLLDLHNVLRTRILSTFLRLKGVRTETLHKPRAKRRALTRRHNKVLLPLPSQREVYAEVFDRAGLDVKDTFSGLYGGRYGAPATDYAAITAPKPVGEIWVGIAPFAAHAGKVYPEELMERVMARLQKDADSGRRLRIFLFGGGPHEETILNAWGIRFTAATSLAGKHYGFKAELALLNHLDVMLSMDSGNMHLAAIAGTPTLSMWGATHPYCGFMGWNQTDADMIQVPLACRPCSVFGDKACFRGDLQCLRAIRPEQVYARIAEKIYPSPTTDK